SRITERFGRPSCVIAWEGDRGTGSLRSIAGVDIGSAVRAAAEGGLLIKGGGHAMAAGLTVAKARADEARAYIAAAVKASAVTARAASGLDIDGALTPGAATAELIDLIEPPAAERPCARL
ncbi:MAG TPA: DHHA1 domain-containing protein, partial [Hyphomicrobiaceae bacterium]|nr:DHHA1 domain-containing protein [Hyphomicrobiaceae bacterium]